MPGRAGQLDEISEAIGRMEGRFEGVDRYIHERQHDIKDLTQVVNGLGNLVSREIASAKAEINASVNTALERVEARIATIDERVGALEKIKERESGAKGVAVWLLQSPLIAWIFAAAVMVAAWWKGVPK